MIFKKVAVVTALAGSALSVGAFTTPAHAASWHNTGQTFYWHSSCDAAGKAGMQSGWQAYDCKGSSAPWASYELWGLY
ncbi:hypothetical protein BJF79_37545 [Actinomadura sp. CNU-125]|uniref:hypothetical protein n=1 Tax=Actinomadura sp. CNU-125 TaxID=1904961 RepID=UPI00095FCFFC|nr:hypothetical protein [Actinomadura sp. CNU-125]OLT31078.1 hypothetical protein BJF79_37545 [Actinomadura sp. CNU-125]